VPGRQTHWPSVGHMQYLRGTFKHKLAGTVSELWNTYPEKRYPSLRSYAKIIVTFWIDIPLQGNFQEAEVHHIQTQGQTRAYAFG
jgi:hypothetical protein